MRRIPRGLGVIVAGALLLGLMQGGVALAAFEPQIQVHVTVTGHTPGFTLVFGTIRCDGMAEDIGFGVAINDGSGTSADLEAPTGVACQIQEVWPDLVGDQAAWGDWSVEPGGPVAIPEDANVQFTITIERFYIGSEPERDASAWFTPDAFSVDRVYLNKTGGITAEGLISCRTMAETVAGVDPIVNVSWDATQYVGRKTAIHGAYGSDVGSFCYDPDHPATPLRWYSMHPGPGGEAVTAWVYGVDGKFGSGRVIIEADSYSQLWAVTQWWDRTRDDFSSACSPTPRADGWYDQNGDGFCAYELEFGLRSTYALKTTTVRTK
jgi:hypothetical protein